MASPARPNQNRAHLRQLAERACQGERAAFEQLVQRLSPGLTRVLLRRTGGAGDLADELLQKTWIAAWQALCAGRYDPDKAAISTFVYAICHKQWLQHLRQTQRVPQSAEDLAGYASLDTSDDPATALHAAELLDAMRDCLATSGTPNSLTDEERRIVTGLAGAETERSLAEHLGLAASTVHARKLSAYQKLRRCLAAKGFSQEDAERRRDERE